jgi:hypothetical protein
VALAPGGLVYSSVDSGATWTTANAPALDWAALTSSADGSRLVALAHNGDVYTVQLPIVPTRPILPSPRLSISSVGGSLAISWLVPSTHFVPQQNLDLTSQN